MKGHIRLGPPDDLRDYLLTSAADRNKSLANPMAAKLGQGAGKYDDQTNWAFVVMEDWQAGIMQILPDDGGSYYAELDTRFKHQISLPLAPNHITFGKQEHTSFASNQTGRIVTVTGGTSKQKLAYRFTKAAYTPAFTNVLMWVRWVSTNNSDDGLGTNTTNITVSLYAESGGTPDIPTSGTYVNTDTVKVLTSLSLQPVIVSMETGNAFDAAVDYWLVLEPAGTESIEIYCWVNATASADYPYYTGGAWLPGTEAFHHILSSTEDNYSGTIALGIIEAPDIAGLMQPWALTTETLGVLTPSTYTEKETPVGGVHLCAFNGVIFVARGGGADMQYYDPVTDTLTTVTGKTATVLTTWNGLLWRGDGAQVSYSNNGKTAASWSEPLTLGSYAITGLAGMNDYMYVSTREALYYTTGTFAFAVMKWDGVSLENGKGMLHHQGALYIPVRGNLFRYGGAEFLPIGFNQNDGLPPARAGQIVALASHQYWLFALVSSQYLPTSDHLHSIWAYNDQGWHFVMSGAVSETAAYSLLYHASTSTLYAGGTYGVYSVDLPDYNPNPYRTTGSIYVPQGMWISPEIAGELLEIRKDFESVFIHGENFSTTRYADVYWMDDDSTEWEYLGRATSNRSELRWSDPDTRPNTLALRIAIVMTSLDRDETPIIQAIRVKYMPMVQDRFRWRMPIRVARTMTALDGTAWPWNVAEMLEHLEACAKSVPPVILEDIDGRQFEVKVMSAQETVVNNPDYLIAGDTADYEHVYDLVIEQSNTEEYG